jgi:hypothetical protein
MSSIQDGEIGRQCSSYFANKSPCTEEKESHGHSVKNARSGELADQETDV